jgi:hypothetical protein
VLETCLGSVLYVLVFCLLGGMNLAVRLCDVWMKASE